MTKRNTTSNETPSIVLKSIHDAILTDNANATVTTKRMRVWLRANMNDVHDRNASWIFTPTQSDIVRSQFDPAYRAKLERAAKRAAPSTRKPRAKKNDTTANDATVTTPAE